MNNNDFYRQLSLQKTDVEQNIIVRETKLDEIQIEEIPITDILGYGIPASIILFSSIMLLRSLKTGRQRLVKIAEPVKYFSQVPCRKCRFFSSNSYLQCAVHPSTVLKDEAKDCSDYWSK
jgi:hypothetical protein